MTTPKGRGAAFDGLIQTARDADPETADRARAKIASAVEHTAAQVAAVEIGVSNAEAGLAQALADAEAKVTEARRILNAATAAHAEAVAAAETLEV